MHEKPGKSRLAPALIVVAVLLLVGYPLSIGPAYRMRAAKQFDERIYLVVYAPIGAVCRKCESLDRVLNWYGRLWWNPDEPNP